MHLSKFHHSQNAICHNKLLCFACFHDDPGCVRHCFSELFLDLPGDFPGVSVIFVVCWCVLHRQWPSVSSLVLSVFIFSPHRNLELLFIFLALTHRGVSAWWPSGRAATRSSCKGHTTLLRERPYSLTPVHNLHTNAILLIRVSLALTCLVCALRLVHWHLLSTVLYSRQQSTDLYY